MTYITFLVCFIVGELIKLLFPSMEKKWLPYIIGVLGMVLGPLISWELSFARAAEGLIAGFASSGGYDAIKALKKCKDAL